jgi:hypothetical protein
MKNVQRLGNSSGSVEQLYSIILNLTRDAAGSYFINAALWANR